MHGVRACIRGCGWVRRRVWGQWPALSVKAAGRRGKCVLCVRRWLGVCFHTREVCDNNTLRGEAAPKTG